MSAALFTEMWLARAEAGDPIAQFNLGYCHEMGQGTEVDFEPACRWYLRAANQGYPRAQYHLGLAYSYGGPGVAWNLAEASKWLTLAARNGILHAAPALRQLKVPGDVRLLGEQLAREFKPKLETRTEPSPNPSLDADLADPAVLQLKLLL